MIKIVNKITEDGFKRNLEEISQNHYANLLPIINKRILKYFSMKRRKLITDNLKGILIGTPSEILIINKKLQKYFVSNIDRKIISSIFSYSSFTNSKNLYGAYQLAQMLDVRVCPYCNRNFTITVIKSKNKITRPQFDHFFPKSKYPLLALSFYNLIPSCSLCNSTFKGKKNFKLELYIHPYLNGFGNDVKFDYRPIEASLGKSIHSKVTIRLINDKTNELKMKAFRNTKTFKLVELYNEHTDYVSEMIYKMEKTQGGYLKMINTAFPSLATKDELYRIAFGNYFSDENLENRPISKLQRDIFSKLELIYKTTF